VYSEERANRAVRFIEGLRHVKGRWAGTNFILLPWQRERLIKPLFGTLKADGSRQYRTCYVEVGRKNGKSTLAAGIALYMLCADGEYGAEVYGAAVDRDQASIVFNTAADTVRHTPGLASRLKVIDSQKRLLYSKTSSFYRAIPSDAAGSHGFNASAVILDEAHAQPNRDLYDVLTTSVGARRQPLVFIITTAGYDRNSICWELHDYASKVARGLVDDPSFLPLLYAAEEEDDWRSPKVWAKANPSLGETITEEYLAQECKHAEEVPAYQNTFRRLHLSQWTRQETRWLDLAAWDASAGLVKEDELAGRECYAGLDLASTTDIAALVLVFPMEDGEMRVLPYFWVPADGARERARRDRVPYETWIDQGLMYATAGNVIDYGAIRQKLNELGSQFQIRELAYDRWGATQLVQEFQEDGLTVVPMGQGFASMSAPTKELLNKVLGKKLVHGGHPVLRWMADNMVVKQDPAGNIKPDKAKSTERIDGMVALIMALDRAIRHEGAEEGDPTVMVLSW
jgi:phage terminase large subunit-like protein